MTAKDTHNEIDQGAHVVARLGDRTFTVPEKNNPIVSAFRDGRRRTYDLSARIDIVDGQPMFRQVELVMHEPMTAQQVQRLPWRRFAEAALEWNARDEDGRPAYREVSDALKRSRAAAARRRQRQEPGERPVRNRVTVERLREVVALRVEGQSKGFRWDHFAADRLHCTPAYARALASRADRDGIKP